RFGDDRCASHRPAATQSRHFRDHRKRDHRYHTERRRSMIFQKYASTPSSATPIRSAPMSRSGLRRSCACGGKSGPTGECEQCKRKRLSLQTKLRMNQPGDHHEQEADRAAARVTNESAVSTSRTTLGKSSGIPAPGEAPEIVHEVLASNGQPLSGKTAADMSARFGYDFSRVRVHTDARAAESA